MPGDRPSPGFFDRWSSFYDAAAPQRLVYRPVHDAVVRELRHRGGGRVLDVGCGTGILVARLRREGLATAATGCDFSFGMLAHAAGRGADVGWVQADAGRLPVRDRSVDAVVSTESFHWFPDPDRVLAELHRCLTPGGAVLVAVVNPRTSLASRAVQALSGLVRQPAHWPTRAELQDRMAAAGLRVESQRRVVRPLGLLVPTVLTVAVRPA